MRPKTKITMSTRGGPRVSFCVTFRLPRDCSIRRARDYVEEAVAGWRGGLRPPGSYGEDDNGDPIFNLDPATVRVALARRGA